MNSIVHLILHSFSASLSFWAEDSYFCSPLSRLLGSRDDSSTLRWPEFGALAVSDAGFIQVNGDRGTFSMFSAGEAAIS